MENQEIKLEDVRVGDEILAAVGGCKLVYLRVLVKPHVSIKSPTTWNGTPNYVAVKCTTNTEEKTYTYSYGNPPMPHSYTRIKPVCTPYNHNTTKSYQLSESTLWLVRRSTI